MVDGRAMGRGRPKSSSKVARYPARTSFPAWSMMSEPSFVVVVVLPPTKRESERIPRSSSSSQWGGRGWIASMHRERLIYANIRPAPSRFQSTLASRMDNFNGYLMLAIFLGDNGKSRIETESFTEDDWKTDPSKCQVVDIVILTMSTNLCEGWAKISLGRERGAKKVWWITVKVDGERMLVVDWIRFSFLLPDFNSFVVFLFIFFFFFSLSCISWINVNFY